MKISYKVAPIFIALGALMLLTSFVPFAQAQLSIQSLVTITSTAGTCGVRIDSGAPINYGTLTNLQVSGEQRLVFTNTGTANGAISVSGTPWSSAAAGTVMLVSDTHFTPSLGASYEQMAALALNDQPAGIIAPQDQSSIYWRLTPQIADVSFSGDAVQTVRLTATC